jgi:pachytene checkpoint protein 2
MKMIIGKVTEVYQYLGTGKTTLCQALAQKVSIRLSSWFKETKLIQLNAATLLSKFFSESAKYVFEIFTAIERMCHESPDRFVCVLIDEVESLASSRITASERGEVQDSIRATNALLTGFDRVKGQANLIILCTSNMAETLDAAFLDRCGHHIRVGLPGVATQYQILRDAIHELVSCKIIRTDCSIPCYRDAKMTQVLGPNNPGSMILRLCSILDNQTAQGASFERLKSARFLGQLPEWALADRLKTDSCDLDEALQHIAKYISDNTMVTRGLKRKLEQRSTSVEIDGCIAPNCNA